MPLIRLSLVAFIFCHVNALATEQDDQYEESLNPAINIEIEHSTDESNKDSTTNTSLTPEADVTKLQNESEYQQEIIDNELKTETKSTQPDQIIKTETRWGDLTLLNTNVPVNSMATLDWYSGHLPGGFEMATPVIVIHGKSAGPTVCLTAAVHGDEVNGVEIARRVIRSLKADELKGTIISVPVVNIDGLWRKDRYMSDRRDLNRAFPGSKMGSTASRVAHSLFNNIIKHCDSLIDLHSGSMYRENIPQLRVDLTIPSVADIARQFGAISVLQSIAPMGSLRGAATAANIPAVVMEVGGPFTLDLELVETGVKALRSYLSSIDMLPSSFFWSAPQPVFYASSWLRTEQGGILINQVNLGENVKQGELLGVISNPINNDIENIYAPFDAVVLGRAQNQFVSAGYAVFNLGERRDIKELEEEGKIIKKRTAKDTVKNLGLKDKAATLPKEH